jgi:hypothetical protein
MKLLIVVLILAAIFSLSGCFSTTGKVVDHNVQVNVPCKVTMPSKPVMPLTDTGNIKDDIFVKSKKALAEIDLRKGYEAELEAAAGSCK